MSSGARLNWCWQIERWLVQAAFSLQILENGIQQFLPSVSDDLVGRELVQRVHETFAEKVELFRGDRLVAVQLDQWTE